MRRIVLAVLILIVPSVTAVVVYLIYQKKEPTNPEAIGRVVFVAGTGHSGTEDGPPGSASFSDPFGIAIDRKGTLYVTDAGQSNRVRRIAPDGRVETIAGSNEGYAEGAAPRAQFNTPSGIAIDRRGNIIIADTTNNRIRKIAPDGQVTTLAGSGTAGFADGSAEDSQFDGPIGVAVDNTGSVFVADTYNDRIRKISSDGNVTTIAGTGSPGFADGDALSGQLNTPAGLAVDGTGNLFVTDTGNSAVRRISPLGQMTTVARHNNQGNGDGVAIRHPVGIVVTHDGFLFVTDANGVVRIAPDGSVRLYAGGAMGFAEGSGAAARFSSPAGLALDREGNLFVADAGNYLIREIVPVMPGSIGGAPGVAAFIQPGPDPFQAVAAPVIPGIDLRAITNARSPFPWPLAPQNQSHEVTGVAGEARGAPGGVALDHLHSGLDIRGNQGDDVLAVLDEKVSSPVANWDFGGEGEGIQVSLMSYIHVRVGRNSRDEIRDPRRFRSISGSDGVTTGVRVRRGTRFKVGEFIGTVNMLYHVHLNLGPWNAQANPLALRFANLSDTTPPTVEPNGIRVSNMEGQPFETKIDGRLRISGDVRILVRAYDRVDGNAAKRKLGLYRAGYQLVREDGTPVEGFEEPLINIEFNRLPPDDSSVREVYAAGSGVSAYGTPTEFNYIVTNRVRDGRAAEGLLRTSALPPGAYVIRVLAEDYAGNRATGGATEIAIEITR